MKYYKNLKFGVFVSYSFFLIRAQRKDEILAVYLVFPP